MDTLKTITIVGGGTTGWIAAAMLAHELGERCHIRLVESEAIGTIGVGESTIPPFLSLLQSLDIDEADFVRATAASFKLGIEFVDWKRKGERYFHPFGTVSAGMDEHAFFHSWLRMQANGETSDLQDYVAATAMARAGKFAYPHQTGKTPLNEARYALHIDAKRAADYFRSYAQARGVERIEGRVVDVTQDGRGHLDALHLESGQRIPGELFIDCTGFYALLIEKVLGVSFMDWSDYLPCNRAMTVQTESPDTIPPYTQATAEAAGWRWRIPLQGRVGNGYVYASEYCSDEQARQTLLDSVEGQPLTDPMVIHFKTGRRAEFWKGNCLCLGLAAGFVEPLESTAIHLAARGMIHLMRNFPDRDFDAPIVDEYNRRMRLEYEEVRDFIVLHYCLTQRDDTAFWRWCAQAMPRPASLEKTLAFFKVQGGLQEVADPLFGPLAWRSVCEGMGVRPSKFSPLVQRYDAEEVARHLKPFPLLLEKLVAQLPSHRDFIQQSQLSSLSDAL